MMLEGVVNTNLSQQRFKWTLTSHPNIFHECAEGSQSTRKRVSRVGCDRIGRLAVLVDRQSVFG